MGRGAYRVSKQLSRVIRLLTIRLKVIYPERLQALESQGPCLLAPTHVSHLEPFFVSLITPRFVRWMARVEFYKYRVFARLLDAHLCFPVNRQGVPVSTIRTAIRLLEEGECVGIFPEGGVSRADLSVMRGADIKKGACLLSQRTGVPIVPVAMAGTHALNRPWRWLPFRWGYVVAAVGEPVQPPEPSGCRRTDRREQADRLRDAYQALYADILEQSRIVDSHDQ